MREMWDIWHNNKITDNAMSMSKLWYRNNRNCTTVLGTVHRAEMSRPGISVSPTGD